MESDWKAKALKQMKQHVGGVGTKKKFGGFGSKGKNKDSKEDKEKNESTGYDEESSELIKNEKKQLFNYSNKVKGKGKGKGKAKGKSKKKKFASVAIILIILVVVVGVLFSGSDLNMAEAFNANASKLVTDPNDKAVEESVGPATAEKLAEGKINSSFAQRLEDQGINVGQVNPVTGNFVKTNVAMNWHSDSEIASTQNVLEIKEAEDGEKDSLVVEYDGEVINSKDLTNKLNSDPAFRKAFLKATGINVNYYYGDEATSVFNNIGVSRAEFVGFVVTGNEEANKKKYDEIVEGMLNKPVDATISNADSETTTTKSKDGTTESETSYKKSGSYSSSEKVSDDDMKKNAKEFIKQTAEQTSSDDSTSATARAAVLLNTAISANEPYQNARVYMSLLIPIQQAKADGTGPIRYAMNALTEPVTTKTTDIDTGEEIETTSSLVGSPAFASVLGVAQQKTVNTKNYSRDREIISTSKKNNKSSATTASFTADVINKTMTAGPSNKNITGLVNNGSTKTEVDSLSSGSEYAVGKVMYSNVSETSVGAAGGHAAVGGGAFIGNKIAQHAIGSTPADSAAVISYYEFVDSVIAKDKEADIASLSPFDISSPNTFLGSILKQFSTNLLVLKSSETNIVNTVSTISNVTNSSIASLLPSTSADDKSSNDYYNTFGNCPTLEAIGAVGDSYCNEIMVAATKYINKPLSWFEEQLGEENIKDGQIVKNSDLARFITLYSDRVAPFGVTSADVCEELNKIKSDGLLGKIASFFTKIFTDGGDMSGTCAGQDKKIVTGKNAVREGSSESDKMDLYAGYILAVQANKIIGEFKPSSSDTSDLPVDPVTALRNDYRAEHPIDNSPAGYIARISGMSKEDAQLAINYASYLNYVAMYDPSEKYDFTHSEPVQNPLEKLDFSDEVIAQYIKPELVVYDSIRYRNFAV